MTSKKLQNYCETSDYYQCLQLTLRTAICTRKLTECNIKSEY